MEDDDQDRKQVDSETESGGATGRGRKEDEARKQQTLKHVMTCA